MIEKIEQIIPGWLSAILSFTYKLLTKKLMNSKGKWGLGWRVGMGKNTYEECWYNKSLGLS